MQRLLARLRYLIRRRQLDADLAEEMESHRSMVQERLQQAGVSADEARRESRRTLGNVTLAREDAREMWMWPSLERFWQDVRFGGRMLRKQPTFTATAIATLAIGIGATTTMVSVVNGELWRPLPFHDPDRLVSINSLPSGPSSFDLISSAELERWQRAARSLEAVAASGSGGNRVLRSGKVPESIRTLEVTSKLLRRPRMVDGHRAIVRARRRRPAGCHSHRWRVAAILQRRSRRDWPDRDPRRAGRADRGRPRTRAATGIHRRSRPLLRAAGPSRDGSGGIVAADLDADRASAVRLARAGG